MDCDSEYPEGNGQYLSIMVDTPDIRTRAVDLNPGAALYLKNIWVGVYDVKGGKKVGGGEVELDRMLTASGNTLIDLVPITANLSNTSGNYCIVGVANYDDKIITYNGETLYKELTAATSWDAFTQIAIDTQKSEFENQVPLLVGYLQKETVNAPNVKVNQFVSMEDVKDVNLNIYNGTTNDVFVSRKNNSNTAIQTKYYERVGLNNVEYNYVLKLRRLRSKINVVINEEPVPGVTVTNLQYKICNAPASAFLAQRRTNSFDTGMTGVAYSPNSADVLTNGRADGYFETEYVSPQVNTNFSFEHFENLHWARYTEGLEEYHDREKKDNGAFSALATSPEDWNNRATYFVLKMNIRDDNLGRNAEVEYTIHEGFCNDANGVSLVKEDGETKDPQTDNYQTRLKDFACVRNTDYYYKITIKSINDIFVQVTDSDKHTTDQQGKIWDIDYVNGKTDSRDPEPFAKDKEFEVEEGLDLKTTDDFDNAKDIAFRFVGSYYDTDRAVEVPVDICYNFKRGDLDGFAGLWNAPTNESSEYIVATGEGDEYRSAYQALVDFYNGSSDNAVHFKQMINTIQVKHGDEKKYYNIVEYLGKVIGEEDPDSDAVGNGKEPVNPNIDGFKFSGLKYYEAFDEANDNKRNHLRGLYIFDVQKAVDGGTRVQVDEDKCTRLYKINGIEQVPVYLNKENYEMIYITQDGSSSRSSAPIPSTSPGWSSTDFKDFHDGNGMLLSEHPELAFRLLGFDENTDDYYDFLYNVTQSEYTDFTENGKWPPMNRNGIYSITIPKGSLDDDTIPQSFLEDLKVIVNGTDEYDIYSLIDGYEKGNIRLSETDRLGFKVSTEYKKNVHTSDEGKYIRALYLFDKKNKFVKPALFDESDSSATFQAYAIEQYPTYRKAVKLVIPNNTTLEQTSSQNFFVDSPATIKIPVQEVEGEVVDPAYYKYKVIVKDGTGANANVKGECVLNGDPTGGFYTFAVPMKVMLGTSDKTNADCYIYVQAVSAHELYSDQYIHSEEKLLYKVNTSDAKVALTNSISWDFTSTTWSNKFKNWANPKTGTWSYDNDNQYDYYQFTNTTRTDGYLNFYASSTSKQIRGYVATKYQNKPWPASFLGLMNSSTGCDLYFKVYKNCKVIVTGIMYEKKTTALNVVGGDPASFPVSGEYNEFEFTSEIRLEDYATEKEVTISSSGGVYLFKIEVKEL